MAVTNQRTVTIKMTRGQALRLCRLINNHAFLVRNDALEKASSDADEWIDIRDKVRAGVDALDQKEVQG